MRFNLIFDFHKKPNWKEFYLEYKELNDYIKSAKEFFSERVKLKCQKHPEKNVFKRIESLENRNTEENPNDRDQNENNINLERGPSVISFVKLENKIETQEQFSKDYILKFEEKLDRVKNFFLEVKNDLVADYEHLKHLVLECEHVENIKNVNVIANLRSIKHDYDWQVKKHTDEITCRLAFIHLYKLATLLENFIVINKIAAQKIIHKYTKYFVEDTETIKDLDSHLEKFEEIIKMEDNLKQDILKFYTNQFFAGDMNCSEKVFQNRHTESLDDYKLVYILLGVVFFLLIAYLLLTFLVAEKLAFTIQKIHVYFPAFSFSLMIILFMIFTPLIVIIMKKYKVNYIYLLELDPELIYNPSHLLKQFLALLIIWEIVFILYRLCLSYFYQTFKSILFIFPIIILCIIFIYAFWPFGGLLKNLRICLLILMIKCILPVTRKGVKFRDFIFADVLTSYAYAFANLTAAMCLLYCKECKQQNQQFDCLKNILIPIALFFPIFIRILQCLNLVYYGQKRKIEVINTIKYTIHGSDLVLGWLYGRGILHKIAYLCIIMISSTFLLCFDNMVDWNLWNLKSKNFLLRDKLIYPKWFYYYAIIINAVLRYFWFASLVLNITKDWILLISGVLEIYRRAQWCLIRIENEQLYNLEGYRSYLPIPEMPVH